MKARNLYKKDGRTYEGANEIELTKVMAKRGFRVNVWVTPNQMRGVGYKYGQLHVKEKECPTVIQKFDYRTEDYVMTQLYNLDQTDFKEKFRSDYEHLANQDAALYDRQHSGFSLKRLAAMF